MAEQFQEVVAPAQKPDVPTRGVEALAQAGRRLGQLGNEKAGAIREGTASLTRGLNELDTGFQDLNKILNQHEETQEIIHGTSAFSDAQLTVSEKLQAAQAEAVKNGTHFDARAFVENEVLPAAHSLEDTATTEGGKRYMAQHGEAFTQHFTNQALQVQSVSQGEAAKSSVENTLLKTTAAVASNPDNLRLALDQLNSSAQALAQSGNLTAEQRGHISGPGLIADQQKLIITAAKTKIDADPNADMSGFFKSYGERMGGEAINTLTTYQQVRQRTAKEQQRSDDHQVKEQQVEAVNTEATKLLASVVQPDGKLVVPPKFFDNVANLSALPGAKPGQIKMAIDFAKAINDENASGKMDTTDPKTAAAFNSRLYDTDHPLTEEEVYAAKINHKISNVDFNNYRGYASQASKPEFKAQNEQIKLNQDIAHSFFFTKNSAGLDMAIDPAAPTAMSIFNSQFNAGVAAARANGSLTEYLTPGSNLYWGNTIRLPDILKQAKSISSGLGIGEQSGANAGTLIPLPEVSTEGKRDIGSFFSGMFGGKK